MTKKVMWNKTRALSFQKVTVQFSTYKAYSVSYGQNWKIVNAIRKTEKMPGGKNNTYTFEVM